MLIIVSFKANHNVHVQDRSWEEKNTNSVFDKSVKLHSDWNIYLGRRAQNTGKPAIVLHIPVHQAEYRAISSSPKQKQPVLTETKVFYMQER